MAASSTLVLQSLVATLRTHSPSYRRHDSPPSSSPLPSPSELLSDALTKSKHFSHHWPAQTSATRAPENAVLESRSGKETITHHQAENNAPSNSEGSLPERKKFRRPQGILQRIALENGGGDEPRESGEKVKQGNECDCSEKPAVSKVKSDILPPKKSRKKKKGDVEKGKQGKINTTKVRKLRVSNEFKDNGKAKCARKAGAKSKDPEVLISRAIAEKKKKKQKAAQLEEQGLQLDKALPRKRSWSPVPDTGGASVSEIGEYTNTTHDLSPEVLGASGQGLGSLLVGYGFAAPEKCNQPRAKSSVGEVQKINLKKRKVDLVDGIMQPPKRTPKARKSQSPKKKPQTITAKATAPFAAPIEGKDTLDSFLGVDAASNRPDSTAMDSQKAQGKCSKSKSKARGTKNEPVILLSPESAMKATKEQRLVFGTSSQLVREDSPTLIEHLQRAMKDSEASMPVSHGRTFQQVTSNLAKSQRLGLTPSKCLWYAAAREHEVEPSDLENAQIEVSRGRETMSAMKVDSLVARTETDALPASPELDEWLVLDDTVRAPKVQKLPMSPQPETPVKSPKKHQRLGSDGTRSLHDAGDRAYQSPTKTKSVANVDALNNDDKEKSGKTSYSSAVAVLAAETPPLDPDPNSRSTVGRTEPMPNYKNYTELQLKRAIEGYGLKPIKSRNKMIERLEKCWEGKQELARQAQHLSTGSVEQPHRKKGDRDEAGSASTIPEKPTTKRGRSKKTVVTTAALEEEAGGTKPKSIRPPKSRPPEKSVTSKTSSIREASDTQTQTQAPKTAVVDDDDEIYDSAPPTPSPPRRQQQLLRQPGIGTGKSSPTRSKKKRPTPTPLTLSPSSSQMTVSVAAPTPAPAAPPHSTAANPNNQTQTQTQTLQTRLLTAITTAITSPPPVLSSSSALQPPSSSTTRGTGPVQLSLTWHEKILLYDPIVLEDLTTWLDQTGLAAVGEELEVDAETVKAWCESNGVCCLWRDGAGGKKVGRGGAGGRW